MRKSSGFTGRNSGLWDVLGITVQSGYEARYASNWPTTVRHTHLLCGGYWTINPATQKKVLVKGYCCFPGCWRRGSESECHHMVYQDLQGAIAGRELPGIHCVILCDLHHGRTDPMAAHHPRNWNPGILPPPTLDACNTAEYWQLLRRGWLEKREWVKRNTAIQKPLRA